MGVFATRENISTKTYHFGTKSLGPDGIRCQAVMCLIFLMTTGALLTGCGGGPSSVSGNVTLDGQPLAGKDQTRVTIMFYPESGGAPAAALADEYGGYSLATGAQKGLAPGNYVVIIAATESTPAAAGGMPGKRMITPAKYADPKQSGFHAEVKPGRNTFDFDLKSSG